MIFINLCDLNNIDFDCFIFGISAKNSYQKNEYIFFLFFWFRWINGCHSYVFRQIGFRISYLFFLNNKDIEIQSYFISISFVNRQVSTRSRQYMFFNQRKWSNKACQSPLISNTPIHMFKLNDSTVFPERNLNFFINFYFIRFILFCCVCVFSSSFLLCFGLNSFNFLPSIWICISHSIS